MTRLHFCLVIEDAVEEQRMVLNAVANSAVAESSPPPMCNAQNDKIEEIYEPLGLNIQQLPPQLGSNSGMDRPLINTEFHVETVEAANNVEERLFIPNLISMSPMRCAQGNSKEMKSLAELRNSSDEDVFVSLQLGDREHKKLRSDPQSSSDLQE